MKAGAHKAAPRRDQRAPDAALRRQKLTLLSTVPFAKHVSEDQSTHDETFSGSLRRQRHSGGECTSGRLSSHDGKLQMKKHAGGAWGV